MCDRRPDPLVEAYALGLRPPISVPVQAGGKAQEKLPAEGSHRLRDVQAVVDAALDPVPHRVADVCKRLLAGIAGGHAARPLRDLRDDPILRRLAVDELDRVRLTEDRLDFALGRLRRLRHHSSPSRSRMLFGFRFRYASVLPLAPNW